MNWLLRLPLLALIALTALTAATCTPAPATAATEAESVVEFRAPNDVGGAILLFSKAGPCEQYGGKMSVSLSKEEKPLWYGCWAATDTTIYLVWLTESGPQAFSFSKEHFTPGKAGAPKSLQDGGTKL